MNKKTIPFSDELIRDIAAKYGTPFHIYDEKGILENVKRLQKAFSWNPNFHEYFAVKATPNPWIMKSLKTLNVGSDCSSMAELVLSETVGIKGEEIVFSSNDTPDEEFIKAHELGAIINLDDVSNLDDLERLHIVPERICFRYNPGPELARGNAIIGKPEEAKYGMTYDQLMTCVDWAKKKGIGYIGIHTMVISAELELPGLLGTIDMMFDLANDIREKKGVTVDFIDFGGGIGIPYRPEQDPVDIEGLGEGAKKLFDEKMAGKGFDHTSICFECGRAITGPYGFLVTKAIHYKHIYRDYIGVDACMADLMRPGIYGAYHHITVLGKADAPKDHVYDVVGSLCENCDKFAIQRPLPEIRTGDLIVIHDTGAHGHSMGYNYNGRLRHQEIMVHADGSIQQIRRNETLFDLFATLDFPNLKENTAKVVK
ncbi:diaminopimelate decarboxylase family protein [Dialister sp.]|jgi:diaminopimelate decarboxylase|uniref:diaminopimelate decarboxylase family protein n=1 Tax=Dialister sp. TaxID=1955814 RepID=UPI003A5BD074